MRGDVLDIVQLESGMDGADCAADDIPDEDEFRSVLRENPRAALRALRAVRRNERRQSAAVVARER